MKPSFKGIQQNIRLKIWIQDICRKWQGAVQSYFVEGNVQDLCKKFARSCETLKVISDLEKFFCCSYHEEIG